MAVWTDRPPDKAPVLTESPPDKATVLTAVLLKLSFVFPLLSLVFMLLLVSLSLFSQSSLPISGTVRTLRLCRRAPALKIACGVANAQGLHFV